MKNWKNIFPVILNCSLGFSGMQKWNSFSMFAVHLIHQLSNFSKGIHTTYNKNIMCQKCGGVCGLWFLNEIIKKISWKNEKKLWEPFGSYLLNSTANPVHFHSYWAGLAEVTIYRTVLQLSSKIMLRSHYIWCFQICRYSIMPMIQWK